MENYQKIMVLIIYLIVLFVFIHTYIYLNQLTTCECFVKNNKYSVNIEFMKFFQILEIFIFTIYIGFMLFMTSTTQNTSSPKILASISLALLVGISGYMAYNVINLYMNISDDCKCATSAYRYFLYYQGVVGASTVLRFISLFLMIGLALLFNHRIAI